MDRPRAKLSATYHSVIRVYLILMVLSTLASSFIWGVNTLFLLDAGLSNTQAFVANGFFTLGSLLFEVPTGVVADTRGRRFSYLLGSATLMLSTVLYLVMWQTHAPLWGWAIASILLGLGFTFFSGATEAWLVDALAATGYPGDLETVFSRGQVFFGISMLLGAVGGGFIAQATNLAVPYIIRILLLAATLVVAYASMRDLGFSPVRGARPVAEFKRVLAASIENGWRVPTIRLMMLEAVFSAGLAAFIFYAAQPYLLELYGDPRAFGVAGIAAAAVAGAQIVGGLLVPTTRRLFTRRTTIMLLAGAGSVAALVVAGVFHNFWVTVGSLVVWGFMYAVAVPIRQAFLNGMIPSAQRATVLSFDSLMGSAGGAVSQPLLGRAADVFGYGPAYLITGIARAVALPFVWLARKRKDPCDQMFYEVPEISP